MIRQLKGAWLGKSVDTKGAVIGKFGDEVICCSELVGDTWRRRHDGVKQQVVNEALLSSVHLDCEVYGQFSDLLPNALEKEGGELQFAKAGERVRAGTVEIRHPLPRHSSSCKRAV